MGKCFQRRCSRRICVDVLARSIADEAARSDIEALCDREGEHYVTVDRDQDGRVDARSAAEVARAVAYLEMRGRLSHHPQRAELVRLL
jgi:hypothetical protein